MKKTALAILLLIAFIFSFHDIEAQCAMCRATAESASDNVDQGIGEGLNKGIVYLMVLPYLLIGTIVVVFFRKQIKSFLKPGHQPAA